MATQAAPETPTGQLRRILPGGHLHPVNQVHLDEATLGERMADKVAGAIGTWRFLIVQGVIILAWVAANVLLLLNHGWDPYPFILLNLMFSIQAAYTGPVLLLAGNRHAQHDRLRLEHTAAVEEAASRVTLEILKEIERNTECTLKVAEHIRNRDAEFHRPV
ncbi:MAG: DUF1003 domain-containing protein [Candidatus Dormibacteraeota bacterium]|nr:DUF1003 domain-containing protein [Candidatus Dormibacteraeota bacterium]